MKQCSKCKEVKSLDSFYNKLKNKDGKSYSCKTCDAKSNSVWHKNNKEKTNKRKLEWRKLNPEKVKECSRKKREKEQRLNPERARRRRNKWKTKNPEKHKLSHLKHRLKSEYGISLESYFEILNEQQNCCAICGTNEKDLNTRLNVDHSHETGKIRGLLCFNCNTGLGQFKDNPELLEKATNYLAKQ